eukprot:IDg21456t1
MTDSNSESVVMSKAEASTRYNRLITLTERVKSEDEFYELYLGVARNVLESFPIASSQATSAAVMPDIEEVSETMSEMLPAPSTVFSDAYFGRLTYAIKVLQKIASFYGFGIYLRIHGSHGPLMISKIEHKNHETGVICTLSWPGPKLCRICCRPLQECQEPTV